MSETESPVRLLGELLSRLASGPVPAAAAGSHTAPVRSWVAQLRPEGGADGWTLRREHDRLVVGAGSAGPADLVVRATPEDLLALAAAGDAGQGAELFAAGRLDLEGDLLVGLELLELLAAGGRCR